PGASPGGRGAGRGSARLGARRGLMSELPAATRPRLTAGERRQAVLEAACQAFFKKSYRGATTAEIAREAGITEPILYRHFGSKRDLYLACLDEAWRIFREFAEEAIEKNPVGC